MKKIKWKQDNDDDDDDACTMQCGMMHSFK